MPNLMQFLRMRNLFGTPDPSMIGNDLPSQGGITGNMFGPRADDYGNTVISPQATSGGVNPAIADDNYDVGSRMAELYTPETAASERFNSMAANYPKREDYHPSGLRRIGGALTALGSSFGGPPNRRFQFNPQGIGMGLNLVDQPYTDKLSDWKNQIGPAQTAANMERMSNQNERTMAYQTVANELRQHRDDAKAANDTKKTEIAESRMRIYEFKAHNPGAKFDFTGPTVKVADPITHQVTDTGVPTQHMSKLDELNLRHENTMEEIGARGGEAANVAGINAKSRETVAETRGWSIYNVPDGQGGQKAVKINQITGEVQDLKTPLAGGVTKPTSSNFGSSGKGEPANQTRVRQFNTARELFNTDPDARKFIKLGSPGASDFTVNPPSKAWWTGATDAKDEAKYQEIRQKIYGNMPAINQPGRTGASNTSTNTTVQPPKAPAGWKYVPKPGGGWTAVEDPTNKG